MTLANTSWLKDMYVKALKDGSSVVAVNKEGKLMGVRVGKVTRYHITSRQMLSKCHAGAKNTIVNLQGEPTGLLGLKIELVGSLTACPSFYPRWAC